ncbi:MAG TPA: DUF1043 family protein [Candidatus Binatia bacterium]|nr:DUF1043 family protein [Candidatus Binatia bacterium]
MNPILLSEVLLLIGGIALGVVLGFFLLPARREAKRLRLELEQTRAEHEEYKSGVSAHFVKTAELVGEMTKSYAAVYDHLAGGAQKFCTEVPDTALTFGARPALGDGRTFTSTAETVEEIPTTQVPLSKVTAAAATASAANAAAAAAAMEDAPVVDGSSVAAGDGLDEAGQVESLSEDDPVHATAGIMPEPGLSAEPGELEDGAPASPKF